MSEERQSLEDAIVNSIDQKDIADLIQQATQEGGLQGNDLYETLIVSGVSYGATIAERLVALRPDGRIELIKDTLRTIDKKLVEAMDDDAMSQFLHSLRAPLIAEIQRYLGEIRKTRAAIMESRYSVPRSVYLDRDLDQHKALNLPRSPAFVQPYAFFGWLHTKEPGKLQCRCPVCLTQEFQASGLSPNEAIMIALTKYSFVDEAARAFTEFIIRDDWAKIDEVEKSFGNLTQIDAEEISDITRQTIANLVNPKGHY